MEICLDHVAGAVSASPTIEAGSLPDVAIIASAPVGNNVANVLVRDGGYVEHA